MEGQTHFSSRRLEFTSCLRPSVTSHSPHPAASFRCLNSSKRHRCFVAKVNLSAPDLVHRARMYKGPIVRHGQPRQLATAKCLRGYDAQGARPNVLVKDRANTFSCDRFDDLVLNIICRSKRNRSSRLPANIRESRCPTHEGQI